MSQHRLARRTFLQGMGLSVGLPLLEAMIPQQGAGRQQPGPGQPPVRIAFVFFPNGAIMPSWTPKAEGEGFEFTPTLKPLEPFRSRITVVLRPGAGQRPSQGRRTGRSCPVGGSYLTGAHPYKTSGANIRVGVSVDQVAADRVGHLTRLPSLELGIEAGRNAGNCDSGYSCAYSSNVSWKTESTPMAKEIHPRLVFERLFGSGDQSSQTTASNATISTQEHPGFRRRKTPSV
jgi:hypothetical protein